MWLSQKKKKKYGTKFVSFSRSQGHNHLSKWNHIFFYAFTEVEFSNFSTHVGQFFFFFSRLHRSMHEKIHACIVKKSNLVIIVRNETYYFANPLSDNLFCNVTFQQYIQNDSFVSWKLHRTCNNFFQIVQVDDLRVAKSSL